MGNGDNTFYRIQAVIINYSLPTHLLQIVYDEAFGLRGDGPQMDYLLHFIPFSPSQLLLSVSKMLNKLSATHGLSRECSWRDGPLITCGCSVPTRAGSLLQVLTAHKPPFTASSHTWPQARPTQTCGPWQSLWPLCLKLDLNSKSIWNLFARSLLSIHQDSWTKSQRSK